MSKLATLFGGPKIPAPAPLPPVVKREDPEIEAARKRKLAAAKLTKGRRSSVLTGGAGIGDDLGSVSRPGASGTLG